LQAATAFADSGDASRATCFFAFTYQAYSLMVPPMPEADRLFAVALLSHAEVVSHPVSLSLRSSKVS
jgi:hypothetical protein